MSQELTTHRAGTVAEKIEWAKAMAPAALLPKAYQGQPANLLLAAEYADALGIERINALTSIHVIEGKPTMSADLMVALARRAGHKVRVQVKDDAVRATLIRADDPDFEYISVWTLDRAKAANLAGKGVWKAYPQAMLRSRAVSEVIRHGASEVLIGGIYTPEELGAKVSEAGVPIDAKPLTEATVTIEDLTGKPAAEDEDVAEAEIIVDETTGELFDTPDGGFPND